MSVNYASGLSPYENKGRCGMPELCDDADVVDKKSSQLAEWIRDSKHLVVITGAGVSTAAGIPDFRGPSGVWTLEAKGQTPNVDVTFETAKPTVSHLALVALEQAGYVKLLVSQNVDGLHLRSGFPCNRLAELHGNMFIEQCSMCHTRYIRESVVPSMKLQLTGNVCTQMKQRGNCRGKLRDTILDWEDALPVSELDMAEKHCRAADLCLCLGTSLQIYPCANLPLLSKKSSGRVVVVNLQATRLDSRADLVLHHTVDVVMTQVCEELGLSPVKWDSPHVVQKSQHTPSDEVSPQVVVDSSLLRCKLQLNGDCV